MSRRAVVKQDIVDALEGNKSWEKLKGLTSLKAVKQSVEALFDSIQSVPLISLLLLSLNLLVDSRAPAQNHLIASV
jgi:hypothetical protein